MTNFTRKKMIKLRGKNYGNVRSVKVAPPHRKFTVYYRLEFWAFFGHR